MIPNLMNFTGMATERRKKEALYLVWEFEQHKFSSE
jgi:hypothetical protein